MHTRLPCTLNQVNVKKSKHAKEPSRRKRRHSSSSEAAFSGASRLRSSVVIHKNSARLKGTRGSANTHRTGKLRALSGDSLHIAATPVAATPVQALSRVGKQRSGQSKRNLFSVFNSGAEGTNTSSTEQKQPDSADEMFPSPQKPVTHTGSRRHRVITATPTKKI